MLGYLKDLKEKTWKKTQTILPDRNLKYFEFEFESVTYFGTVSEDFYPPMVSLAKLIHLGP